MPQPVKLSTDEMLEKRKSHVRSTDRGDAIVKAFRAPASWDKNARTARFVMSAQSPDRYGDIVVTEGLDTTEFEKNPVALLFHSSRSWPIGKWINLEKKLTGRPARLEGQLEFAPEGLIEEADKAAGLVAAGIMRACSIGFLPKDGELIRDDEGHFLGYKYTQSELLECSAVPIPACPQALVKSAGGDLMLARELLEEVLDTYALDPISGDIIPIAEYQKEYAGVMRHFGSKKITLLKSIHGGPAIDGERQFTVKEVGVEENDAGADGDVETAAAAAAAENVEQRAAEGAGAEDEGQAEPQGILLRADGTRVRIELTEKGLMVDGKPVNAEIAFSKDFLESNGLRTETTDAHEDPAVDAGAGEQRSGLEANGAIELKAGKTETIKVDVDTKDAVEKLGHVEGMIQRIAAGMTKLFGRSEPEPAPEPPAPEAIEAARTKAAATLARLKEKGAV